MICAEAVEKRMFFRKKRETYEFDRETKEPVLRASICTGEKVVGFKDKATGRFEEIMLINNDKDLKEFLEQYGIRDGELKKEW